MATREQLEAELARLVKQAKREQHIVHRFRCDSPTPWDRKHEVIDRMLTELDRVREGLAPAGGP